MKNEEEQELGKKYEATPEEHLNHLLNIGWPIGSPLIRKYVRKKKLEGELIKWVRKNNAQRI